MLPKRIIKENFKDNRERFRLLNGLYKEPPKTMFCALSIVALVLSTVPLVYPGAFYSITAWIFYSLGLLLSISLEQVANIHYMQFSKIANKRNIDNIKFHIIVNKTLRCLAMMMWLLIGIAIALMVISKSATLSSIW